ncbi:MAG: hypothetical protein KDK36_13185 [Leptospiraceae bacterium]|nr:hypothetical protein [Leptospiraceae bacterium]
MKLLLNLIILLFFYNCSELFTKSDNSEEQRNNAILGYLVISQGGCTSQSAASIGSTQRTEYTFTGSNCNTSSLPAIGFTGENVSPGLIGTSTASKLASSGSFTLSGEKKMNIEVTYTINSSSGYLDVVGNASVSGSTATGPTFRIKSSTISIITSGGVETAIGTGSPPSSPVGTEKTICLEFHEENGAHMFGWNSACSAISNRSSYDFDQEAVSTTNPGSSIGFILNNVTLKKIIVSKGAIGNAG